MRRLLSVAPVLLWLITPLAFAQLPGITSQPLPGGGQSWSLPVQTLVFITSLTFIPAILLMMTSFTRIIIVFGLLRNALGTPSAPPNQVLLGLALFVARRNFSHRNALNYAPQQTSEKPVLRTVQIKTPRSLSHSNDEAGNLR